MRVALARWGRGALELYLRARGWRWSRRVSRAIDRCIAAEERGR